MPKVQTFTIKAKVINGIAKLDHATKKLNTEIPDEEFDSAKITLKAQEIAEFNKGEVGVIESFKEDGEWEVDFKLII